MTLVGEIATCVGKSRLPELNRLARNTCPCTNGRPFLQTTNRNTKTIPAAAAAAHNRRGSEEISFTGCKITSYALPSSRSAISQGCSLRQAHHVLSAQGQQGSPSPHRRRVPGVQRRPPG